jgi:energy-converting hydrogenase Eha subunit C
MDVVALMVHGLVTVAPAAARRLPLPRLASLLKSLVSVTLCIAYCISAVVAERRRLH